MPCPGKVCNHPYQLPSAELDFDGSTGEDLVQGSGKLAMLDKLLGALKEKGPSTRVLLVSAAPAPNAIG